MASHGSCGFQYFAVVVLGFDIVVASVVDFGIVGCFDSSIAFVILDLAFGFVVGVDYLRLF